MGKSKIHYAVVLTLEAIQAYSADSITKSMLMSGKYFNCVSVEPNGYFINLIVEYMSEALPVLNIPKGKRKAELSIPAHFVSYIVSVAADKNLGFSVSQLDESTVNGNSH